MERRSCTLVGGPIGPIGRPGPVANALTTEQAAAVPAGPEPLAVAKRILERSFPSCGR